MRKDSLIKILKDRLTAEQYDHSKHLLIRKSLESQVGKKVTKRFEKLLPEGYRYKEGMNGPEIVDVDGATHYLCYWKDSHEFKLEDFDERNAPWNAGAKGRATKIQMILDDDGDLELYLNHYQEMEKAVKLLEKVIKRDRDGFGSFSYNNPAHYEIMYKLLDKMDVSDRYKEELKRIL